MTHVGRFRLHFNRHGAAPLVWIVAALPPRVPVGTEHPEPLWELALESVFVAAPIATVYRAKVTPDDDDGRPSARLEVTGVLTVEGSRARIERPAVA
jgi:hypothetical protein